MMKSNSTVFIHNLNYRENEETIYSHFGKVGTIVGIEILKDSQNKSKGLAYVTYQNPQEANACINMFNNTFLSGKMISVEQFHKTGNNILPIEYNSSDSRLDALERKLDNLIGMVKTIYKQNILQNNVFEDSPNHNYLELIPIGEKWQVSFMYSTKNTLSYQGNTYIVEVSDVDSDNKKTHYPYFLFNGIKECNNGNRWATSSHQDSAFIIIRFDLPIIANVLSMTARNGTDCLQAPSSFEIFGMKSESKLQSLASFEKIRWSPNLKLNFSFTNRTEYYAYKIMLYESDFPTNYFGLAEMNLGIMS